MNRNHTSNAYHRRLSHADSPCAPQHLHAPPYSSPSPPAPFLARLLLLARIYLSRALSSLPLDCRLPALRARDRVPWTVASKAPGNRSFLFSPAAVFAGLSKVLNFSVSSSGKFKGTSMSRSGDPSSACVQAACRGQSCSTMDSISWSLAPHGSSPKMVMSVQA
jgi:hypothetical protein